ncbi:MAG: hypothetical protein AB1597_02420 [Chloroflexota bacterium]
MTYKDLVDNLIKAVPEIADAYNKYLKWSGRTRDDPLPHVVFGDVLLQRFLLEELSTMKNTELLNRIFDFFELMAVSDDKDVRDVLSDTVLERIGDDKRILENARSLMRRNTRELSDKAERFLGRL